MINAVAAVITENKKILVVKEFDEDVYHTPGGKSVVSETPKDTLERELREELGVELVSMRPFGKFDDDNLSLDIHFAEIKGMPSPNSEIEDFSWIGKDYENDEIRLTGPMKKFILPKLVEMKLIE